MKYSSLTNTLRRFLEDQIWVKTVHQELIEVSAFRQVELPVRSAAERTGLIMTSHISNSIYGDAP